MKFRVERDVLAEAVSWTARSLPNRPPTPILAGIRLEAQSSGSLTLSSYDYDTAARGEVEAEVSEPGEVLVQGRLLADISRALPPKPVEITLDGNKVVLTCGSSRFTLHTMPVEEYPALPAMPAVAGTIDTQTLVSAVSQVTTAASKDDTLPLLTGVRVEIDGDNVTLLATDRYRLAMREISWSPASPGMETVALVRARTLSDVAKSLTSAGDIEIFLDTDGSSNIVGFQAGGRHTTSMLVDGDYPPVRRLFPEETPIHAVIETAPFIEAARRVSLVAERNTPLRLSFSEGEVVLEAGQGDDAQASEAIEATLVGEDIATAFNPQFLLDGFNALETPYARMSFTHSSKPAVLSGQDELDGDDNDDFRYLFMPIRFGG